MKQSHSVFSRAATWRLAALVAVAVIVLLAIPSEESEAASSGRCGEDVTWTLEDGHLVIEGTGYTFEEDDWVYPAPWGADIRSFEIRGQVYSVPQWSFKNCEHLTSAVIPSSVKIIGESAFHNCTSLKSVEIQGDLDSIGISAFEGCTYLEKIKMPSSVRYVDYCAFDGCNSIKYINIPNNVRNISATEDYDAAFEGMTFLDSMGKWVQGRYLMGKTFVGENSILKETPDNARCYVDGLEYQMSLFYGEAALIGCSDETSKAVVPSTVEYCGLMMDVVKVGNGAFTGPVSLTSIKLPGSITKIGSNAFKDCLSLEYIRFPSSLKSVGEGAFSGIAFADSKGNALDHAAGDLRGRTFIGSDGILAVAPKTGTTFSVDGLSYEMLSIYNPKVALVGHSENVAALVVPDIVEYGGYPMKVTKVGKEAFYGCSELRSLDLGSVREVGVKAFAYCVKLSDARFGDALSSIGAYAFYKCRSLESIEVPDAVSSIGSYAFYRCSSLKDVGLGDSLEKICVSSFSHCPAIEKIDIPKSLKTLGRDCFGSLSFLDAAGGEIAKTAEALRGHSYAGSDKVLVREPEPEVGDEHSFSGIVYRVTRAYPAELEVAGFEGSPASVSIPEAIEIDGFEFAVTSVGAKAFYGCKALRDIEMPSVKAIGVKAFARCSNLTNVGIGDVLEKVSAYAFCRCPSLASFDAPGALELLGSYAFYGCSSLESFDAPDSLDAIRPYAFYGCSSLEDFEFGSSIRSIGPYAFYGCTSLSNVNLECPVEKIGDYAFYLCPLSYMYIPETLSDLGTKGLGDVFFTYWYDRTKYLGGDFDWKDPYYGTDFYYGWWEGLSYTAECLRGHAYEADDSLTVYSEDYEYELEDEIIMKRTS